MMADEWVDISADDGWVDIPATPTPAAPPAKRNALVSEVDRAGNVLNKHIYRPLQGVLEVGTEMATGTVGQVAGGLRGLGSLATGEGVDEAARKVQATQEALTYHPRTREGQVLSRTMALPMEYASKGTKAAGGAIGEAVNGEQGRIAGESIGEVVPAVAATLAGGRAALKAAPAGPPIQETLGFKKPEGPTPAQVRTSRANANKIDAANLARQYDIAIDPSLVNPTVKNKILSSAAGRELPTVLSRRNEARWSQPLKEELGMDLDAPITKQAIEQVRTTAAAPNKRIAEMGAMTGDAETLASIRALRQERLIGGKAAAHENMSLIDEAVTDLESGMPASRVLDNISTLRREARNIYNKSDAGRPELSVAETNIGIANALEDMVEKNLAKQGDTQLLNDYRQGRRQMAKSYVLEDATDLNTGMVDPNKLAKLTSADNALSGAFADVGNIAGNFPQFAKMKGEAPTATLQEHFTRYGVPGVAGGALGTLIGGPGGGAVGATMGAGAGIVARRLAEKKLGSREFQLKQNRPVDYRPLHEQLRYPEPTPEPPPPPPGPEPMGLAPQEGYIPTVPQNLPPAPQPSPLMSLAPMDQQAATVQALRGGQGARIPLGNEPVEFTSGAAMDFPMRQEVLTDPKFSQGMTPSIPEAIQNFRTQAAALQSKVDNAQGFWKQRYQAELDALKAEFGAGMEQLGVRNPQEALGIQQLYEGGNRFPIEKTFDARPEQMGPYLPGALRKRK